MQHLGDEQSELPVAEHDAALARLDLDLREDLESRGERLDEDGALVEDPIGYPVQVRDRHGDEFGDRAIGAVDSHHATRRAMAFEILRARLRIGRRRS